MKNRIVQLQEELTNQEES